MGPLPGVGEAPRPPPGRVPWWGGAVGEVGAPELREQFCQSKGEVGDRDGAGRTEDGGRQPVDVARGVDEHVAGVGDPEGAVIAGDTDKGYSECWPAWGGGRGGRAAGGGRGCSSNLFSSTISGRHTMSAGRRGRSMFLKVQHPTAAGCLSSPEAQKCQHCDSVP